MFHEHLRVLDRAQITQLALAAHVVVAAEARARPSDNLPGDAISFPNNLPLFLSSLLLYVGALVVLGAFVSLFVGSLDYRSSLSSFPPPRPHTFLLYLFCFLTRCLPSLLLVRSLWSSDLSGLTPLPLCLVFVFI
jgi:hypothetical protein